MRTTEADVLELMDTDLTSSQITPFLTTANVIVTDKLAGTTLSTTILEEIEKYLAAHIASVRSKFAIEEQIGDLAKVKTGYKGGEGLQATPYGEMVLMLDTTGTMKSSYGRIVSIAAIDFDLDDDD